MNPHRRSPLVIISIVLVYFFLYAPIFALVLYSFNASRANITFAGFIPKFSERLVVQGSIVKSSPCGPFHWFCELSKNRDVIKAAKNTLTIAFIPFVTLVVQARLQGFDKSFEEAAMDLGANEWTTFRRITFPMILPGILSGALLAFTLSLDDFVITFFTNGPGSTTLPIYVYGLLRRIITPQVNALSTVWITIIFVAVFLLQTLQNREAK